MKKRNTIAAAVLMGLTTAFSPVAAQAEGQDTKQKTEQEYKTHEDDEFTMRISTKEKGKTRKVGIDVNTLVLVELPVKNKEGKVVGTKKALAPTVAFISNFDILNGEALANLSPAQRELIEKAGKNMSVDLKQVAFMLQHVKVAHGVEYAEIKAAAEYAKQYFDMESKLTAEQIKALDIVLIPVKKEEDAPKPSQ